MRRLRSPDITAGSLMAGVKRTIGFQFFFGRMNRALQGRLPEYAAWQSELTLPAPPRPNNLEPQMEGMFFTRMLFSCLVDADYSDTAEFMANGPHTAFSNRSVDSLMEWLRNYISGWFPPKGELNAQRCSILERCIQEGSAVRPVSTR